jgi:hypothetical protein
VGKVKQIVLSERKGKWEKGKGKREKGKGKREKGKEKREKGKEKREKGKGKREKGKDKSKSNQNKLVHYYKNKKNLSVRHIFLFLLCIIICSISLIGVNKFQCKTKICIWENT